MTCPHCPHPAALHSHRPRLRGLLGPVTVRRACQAIAAAAAAGCPLRRGRWLLRAVLDPAAEEVVGLTGLLTDSFAEALEKKRAPADRAARQSTVERVTEDVGGVLGDWLDQGGTVGTRRAGRGGEMPRPAGRLHQPDATACCSRGLASVPVPRAACRSWLWSTTHRLRSRRRLRRRRRPDRRRGVRPRRRRRGCRALPGGLYTLAAAGSLLRRQRRWAWRGGPWSPAWSLTPVAGMRKTSRQELQPA